MTSEANRSEVLEVEEIDDQPFLEAAADAMEAEVEANDWLPENPNDLEDPVRLDLTVMLDVHRVNEADE